MSHLPATSARAIAAGAAMVVEAVEEAIALEVSTAAFSFLAHPARAAAPRQIAMRVVRWSVNIKPPVSGDGRLCRKARCQARRTYDLRGATASDAFRPRAKLLSLSPGKAIRACEATCC